MKTTGLYNISLKAFSCALILLATTLYSPVAILAYTPAPGSPLATNSHPRLHITQDSIPALRQAIATNHLNEYQTYVDWAYSASSSEKGNSIGVSGHEILSPLAVSQAFIYALGPVPGISYPGSLDEYAQKAIDFMIDELQGGTEVAHAAAVIYDWTYHAMTSSERSQIANLIVNAPVAHKLFSETLQNPGYSQATQMFDSKYYEGAYAWYIGIAFWGDGLIDSQADNAVDTFAPFFLNKGYIDAHNWLAGDTGSWPEWSGYGNWHPRVHLLMVDGWRTATGEDFVANDTMGGNAIKNYATWIFHAADPHRYFSNENTYMRVGGAETTDTSFHKRDVIAQLYFLPRELAQSGLTTNAGLVTKFIQHYQVPWAAYSNWSIWNFLGATLDAPAVDPNSIGLEKSAFVPNNGLFIARTGFLNSADGVFYATDGHWNMTGGRGPGENPGFGLAKFGELVNTRVVAHRGYGNLSDYTGAIKDNFIRYEGGHGAGHSGFSEQDEFLEVLAGQGNYDHGGLEQVTVRDSAFYHVRSNRTRMFTDGVSHVREYVWLPGTNPSVDSDFLVVYDRSTAPSHPHWIYHVPWEPSASNFSTSQDITSGSGLTGRIGTAYTGSEVIIKELNGIGGPQDGDKCNGDFVGGADSHGVAFVKTLLPTSARVEVSRVAEFDGNVCKRQHHLAIKSSRWQVDVIPTTTGNDHRFLNVFETADANVKSSMVSTSLLEAGNTMQGTWITRGSSAQPNYVVLFHKNNGVNSNNITYVINGEGTVRHVVSGVLPSTSYKVEDTATGETLIASLSTESDFQAWDYKGVDTNIATGTLYFQTTTSGSQTIKLTPIGGSGGGEPDTTPPAPPTGLQ